MKTNKTTKKTAVPVFTAEGARASQINAEKQLRRSVMACMLWEGAFYEDGEDISMRIASLIPSVNPEKVAEMAVKARVEQKLRHVPLFIAREMARSDKHKHLVSETLQNIIQRPDELTEFLSIYWKEKKQPISNQIKKGLAQAFTKFDEYSLAKYNRQEAIKLRDVLFLTHPKPVNKAQEKIWKKLVDGTLATPDTWEVSLSAGKDKKETFTRLIKEGKLGGLAMLRNLRNMEEAGVPVEVVRKGLKEMDVERVLPFRFITAAKYAPRYEAELEAAMLKNLSTNTKLPGKTVVIVDVSGSMNAQLSAKSELTRQEAANALTMILREVGKDVVIYATGGNDHAMVHATSLVPSRRGFALNEAIKKAERELGGGGIFLTQVMDYTLKQEKKADRVIVITDEQDCDRKCNPSLAEKWGKRNYLINISVEKNGIGYGDFVHIDGWSEAIVDYIIELEKAD